MAVIKVDLSNAGPKMVSEGEHQAFVYDVAQRENKAGDGHYLNWQFKIVGGKDEGQSLWHITSLKENALFKLRELLVALGIPVGEGSFDLDTDELVSKKCTIVVAHGEYNGKPRAEIKDILPAKAGEGDAFEDKDDDF